jgi:RNA polymerase sigma-70 factor, ECF subfamily
MPPEDLPAEAELIRRAQVLNDADAFGQLVRMHQSAVRTFLLRLCRDYHQSNDLAQDSFVRAYIKLDSFQPVGSFLGWLLKIAFRCFLQEHRRVKRRALLIQEHMAGAIRVDWYDDISPEQLALEQALQHLSADEAACISLCCTFGYSHTEAVEILGLPLGTVKSHIQRGVAKLGRMLSETDGSTP